VPAELPDANIQELASETTALLASQCKTVHIVRDN
jgi:hypothetical protein